MSPAPMHPLFAIQDQSLYYRKGIETLWIQPWGPDGLRVRATPLAVFPDLPGALLEPPATPEARAEIQGE